MNQQIYPGVFVRVKAVFVDTVVIILLMFGVSQLFELFPNVPDFVRLAAFIFIFMLYDPLFTSIFGGTIGHMVMGIRVCEEKDTSAKIFFPLAVARFVIKASLGWISLLTVSGNKKGKAIHDMAVKSIVIFK